jgi:lantibiotic modifying enzyme
MEITWVPIVDISEIGSVVDELSDNLRMNNQRYRKRRYNGLAEGAAGIAIACSYMGRVYPNHAWDHMAHKYLVMAVNSLYRNEGLDISLFNGVAGIGIAATYLSKDYTRYNTLISKINKIIIKNVTDMQKTYLDLVSTPSSKYDLISGLAGICTYMLYNKDLVKFVKKPLSILVHKIIDNDGLLGYYTAYPDIEWGKKYNELYEQYEHGLIDVGMAHGISGVLAILSRAYLQGIAVEEQKEAINKIAEWLVHNCISDKYGCGWPEFLPYDTTLKNFNIDKFIYKPSIRNIWCYGVAGIASALLLSGKAIKKQTYIDFSVKAIRSSADRIRPENVPNFFCHGISGVLETYLRFYNYTGDRKIKKESINLLDRLMNAHKSKHLLTYNNTNNEKNKENVGLLTGAAGIFLPILASATNIPPSWDSIFGLSY